MSVFNEISCYPFHSGAMLQSILLSLVLLLQCQSRDRWTTQISQHLCQSEDQVISATRTLANSGFHKDLTTNLELEEIPRAFLLENTTSHFYMDIDQIKEGLFLGYPPVFPDDPIDVEQPADSSPAHIVGVLCETHHVTLPVHHRYQPAGSQPYSSVCIPFPRVFIPVVTPEDYPDLVLGMEQVEEERGCKLLHAPCGVNSFPECGWEEVAVVGVQDVCSSVPVGMTQDLPIVQISALAAVFIGFSAIVYVMFCRKEKSKAT